MVHVPKYHTRYMLYYVSSTLEYNEYMYSAFCPALQLQTVRNVKKNVFVCFVFFLGGGLLRVYHL